MSSTIVTALHNRLLRSDCKFRFHAPSNTWNSELRGCEGRHKKSEKWKERKKQKETNEKEERKRGIERTGSKEMNTQTLFHAFGLTSLPLTTLQFQSQIFRVPP
jgi:hypothetical protein